MQEVTIKKDSTIKIEPDIKEFLNPNFVFLPIKKGFKLKVSDNQYVYKNDIVAMNKDGRILYSTISGHVLGVKDMKYYGKGMIPSLVIENDFKENVRSKKSSKKYISSYTKKELMRIIEDTSLSYKGVYLSDKLQNKSDLLVVNAAEFEPYFENKHFLLKDNLDDVLETIDIVSSIIEAKKVYFILKNTYNDLIKEIMEIIGTYPNIELKLVSDAYPNGMEVITRKSFNIEDAIFLEIEEIIDIYNTLKREVPITEELVTITGNAVTPSTVLKVKKGSLLSEAFVTCCDFTAKNVKVYLNGMMQGEVVNTLKYVIDSNIKGILVMVDDNKDESPCVSCGLCSKTCPMGLNPKYVFDHDGKVKSKYYDKCIQCGLCNYVCLANRDLKSKMKGSDKV